MVEAWLPDASGVAVSVRSEPAKFYLVDRVGDIWELPLKADRILAILAP